MSVFSIDSISNLHELLGLEKPKHPLISLIDAKDFFIPKEHIGSKVSNEFYMISLKDKSCGVDYGRNSFDFDDGVLIFTAPKQVSTITREIKKGEINGWILYFHPALINNTDLGANIDDFKFFNYDIYEALHLSHDEQNIVTNCVNMIKDEYMQRIDNHSVRVIVSTLELLLNYSLRFYERQFNTRTSINKDIVSQFESNLKSYFKNELIIENGIPSIQYFSDKANLSQHYFSDLIKKETSRTPKDHINDYVIKKAKNLLLNTESSVSEIAYQLGFNYPHYFTRLFKSKTGQTPLEFRKVS